MIQPTIRLIVGLNQVYVLAWKYLNKVLVLEFRHPKSNGLYQILASVKINFSKFKIQKLIYVINKLHLVVSFILL